MPANPSDNSHDLDPAEARIVAWVLGEASAFEAAELERLCEERPELRVFHHRMLALHGLLTESETVQTDEAWKLPAGKRKAIEGIFAEEEVHLDDEKDKRIRHSGRRASLAIAACLTVTAIVVALIGTGGMEHAMPLASERRSESKMDLPESSAAEVGEIVVGGQVQKPGSVRYQENLTLADAVDSVGGANEFGSTGRVRVLRDGNLKSYNLADEKSRQLRLEPGDLVEVPQKQYFGDVEPAAPLPASSPAARAKAKDSIDKVRQSLFVAEGHLNLGKFDEAKKQYEETLKLDPYNSTARRGLEKVDAAKSDYYRAAYDNTRAELMAQVDESWELKVPVEGKAEELAAAGELSKARGLRSGDAPISRSALDGILNQPAPMAKPRVVPAREIASRSQTGSKSAETQDMISEIGLGGVPKDQLIAQLRKAVLDQEDKVEERRKVLATIARTKKIIYKGKPDFYDAGQNVEDPEEAIRRGVDAQDYADAETEFESDKETLEKLKQVLASVDPTSVAPVSQPKLVDPGDEITASEEPYSTFSLNVSDASFQIAQAALAKGERPDPAGIKVEQFYNAVDYGDPAPSAGEPVAVSIEQTAHPVVPGRNLVRIALKTAAAGRGKEQPLRLTLLADQSGSMVREDRREAMDTALNGLAKLLTEKDLVTVVGFSRTPRLLADGMPGNEAAKLPEIINQAASEGGTNLEEAMKLGERMAERRKLEGAQNRIVLFTDGAANLGDADPERLAENVNRLRQKGIAFDIAGIAADDLNDELLGELARKGNGRYYVVGKDAENDLAAQLAGAFRPAAENVKVQVRFNPERVGRYKLIGFEKDRLKTEDFRNDAVDAAELAAEEAGVAIYQVEPLPGGKGELGEVSVRFRDTASGQMVERTWTISYDTAASAFDRATPSMQLATLSMLAAEKLRGGPLADAIDFKQLTAASANVKQFYGNTGRVAEVLRMLDVLK